MIMRITKVEYQQACEAKEKAERIINQYFQQKREDFETRMKENPVFTDDELRYSATSTCPCGAGLAYPKECGPSHYWDCSAILKDEADKKVTHTGKLPFAFYDIKSESEYRGTTRPSGEIKD